MPVQKFAPMTKDFPTFDCDAHVTEPAWIWERAKDWLTKDELEALKTTMWFDAETQATDCQWSRECGYRLPTHRWHARGRQYSHLGRAWHEA